MTNISDNMRIPNQDVDLSMNKAFATMRGISEDEEDENKFLLAIEQEVKYDLHALVTMTETMNKISTCQAQYSIYALMAGSDSDEEEETKRTRYAYLLLKKILNYTLKGNKSHYCILI